jgi:hypothetical protein
MDDLYTQYVWSENRNPGRDCRQVTINGNQIMNLVPLLLHNLYSSPDINRQIKSRRMRWAGHVARMGEGRNVYRVLVGKRPLERPRRRWKMGSKWTLGRLVGGLWSGFTWLRIGTVGGLL